MYIQIETKNSITSAISLAHRDVYGWLFVIFFLFVYKQYIWMDGWMNGWVNEARLCLTTGLEERCYVLYVCLLCYVTLNPDN